MFGVPALALLFDTWAEGVLVPPVHKERFLLAKVVQIVLWHADLETYLIFLAMALKYQKVGELNMGLTLVIWI